MRGNRKGWLSLDIQALTMPTQTGPPLMSSVPVPPQQWNRSHWKGMEKDTDEGAGLAVALPLHWHCSRHQSTDGNCECWHHTPARLAAIGALFGVHAGLSALEAGATQRPIGLQGSRLCQ
ncbi:MAG TPA: hypothetical protein VKR06_09105 [Ktedonosporobacter sp.]|nr:hypothetical protein [Ktedonosporobacter sp.]